MLSSFSIIPSFLVTLLGHHIKSCRFNQCWSVAIPYLVFSFRDIHCPNQLELKQIFIIRNFIGLVFLPRGL
ncbi:hypothetical protein C8R48DRAFT_743211 [Suillus tomentosus]|nr:hypothetical protein C8R48DRAFT_743211 [Suillus tomentosus]